MKEKTLLSHEVVCVQMVDFETSSSKSEVSKSNSWKITSFSKTMAHQRVPFLTMFYTINLSPLLVTKKGFMLIIILSINYQQCPLPSILYAGCPMVSFERVFLEHFIFHYNVVYDILIVINDPCDLSFLLLPQKMLIVLLKMKIPFPSMSFLQLMTSPKSL